MTRVTEKLALLAISVAILIGCKQSITGGVYCNQTSINSGNSKDDHCFQLDSSTIELISRIITQSKPHKRPNHVSLNDGYFLPGELNLVTNSSQILNCKIGVNKLICETNLLVSVDKKSEATYDSIFGLIEFYSKLRASANLSTSCRDLIFDRLKKHDSAITMMTMDVEYYTAAGCSAAERNKEHNANNDFDLSPDEINYINATVLCCIPGMEPPSFDSCSSGLSKSLVEFAGRLREFHLDKDQIKYLCKESNSDSLINWARSRSEHHKKEWNESIRSLNHVLAINPNCDTAFRKAGIVNKVIMADRTIRILSQEP